MEFDFKDKRVLVTGSSSGIGKATALLFAKLGASVIINGTNPIKVKMVFEEINAINNKGLHIVTDVSNHKDVEKMFSSIEEKWGGIDILINNAGIIIPEISVKMSEEHWDKVINVNLKSVFNCSKFAARLMIKQKYGKIVNLGSVSAQVGSPGQLSYVAAKGGVIQMTKTLARELAQFNINVNCISPGYIKTPMTKHVPEEIHKYFLDITPLSRMGEPDEVAKSIIYLASDESSFMTGHTLQLNGGVYV